MTNTWLQHLLLQHKFYYSKASYSLVNNIQAWEMK